MSLFQWRAFIFIHQCKILQNSSGCGCLAMPVTQVSSLISPFPVVWVQGIILPSTTFTLHGFSNYVFPCNLRVKWSSTKDDELPKSTSRRTSVPCIQACNCINLKSDEPSTAWLDKVQRLSSSWSGASVCLFSTPHLYWSYPEVLQRYAFVPWLVMSYPCPIVPHIWNKVLWPF